MKVHANWTRREFLSAITVAGIGSALISNPLSAWAADDLDPRVAAIVAATIGIDTHNHIDVPLTAADIPGPDIDLSGEMKRSGLSAICMTFALDYQKLTDPGEAYERFKNGLSAMDQELARNSMKRSLNMADLRAAHQQGRPTVIQSVEGAHFLEGQIDRLGVAYGRGLRHLGLLHDSDASVPLGDVYTNPPRWGGLSVFGAEVIRECNRLGILVDMAHASNETLAAAIKVSAHPLLISHTGLDTQLGQDPGMARMMRPRLISKEAAKMVADSGGVIGVWTHQSDTPLEYARNIRALVDVAGVDHVCIGTDTKLTTPYHPAGGFGPKPANDSGNHHDGPPMNGPHGGQGGVSHARVGERTNQVWPGEKNGFYYTVVDAMLKAGFSQDEISKVGGGNFCRLFDAATAGHN